MTYVAHCGNTPRQNTVNYLAKAFKDATVTSHSSRFGAHIRYAALVTKVVTWNGSELLGAGGMLEFCVSLPLLSIGFIYLIYINNKNIVIW